MANACAKCGAELIGSRKFCAACGTPVGDARALGSGEPKSASSPPSAGNVPASLPILVPGAGAPVNPFAATAPPNTMSPVAARSSSYGPSPETSARTLSETETDPNALPMLPTPTSVDPGSLVSPLAVSNIVTQGEGVDSARKQLEAAQQGPDAALSRKAPGTQLMPSIPRPGVPASSGTPSAKRQDRTHVMSAFDPRSLPSAKANAPSTSKMPAAPPAPGSSPASGPSSQPGAQQQQQHGAGASGRGSAPPAAHGYAMPPSSPHAAGWSGAHPPPPMSAVASAGAPPWSHAPAYPPASPPMPPAAPYAPNAHAPHAPPSYGYPSFGYAPGTRVLVTWSTGQRYPATVQQVTGTQLLVLFPDGQQHWVDMQYVSPGG